MFKRKLKALGYELTNEFEINGTRIIISIEYTNLSSSYIV